MNEISAPLRLLYYLNISKENEALKNIAADREVFDYYIHLPLSKKPYGGYQDVKDITKQVLKLLKGAVK